MSINICPILPADYIQTSATVIATPNFIELSSSQHDIVKGHTNNSIPTATVSMSLLLYDAVKGLVTTRVLGGAYTIPANVRFFKVSFSATVANLINPDSITGIAPFLTTAEPAIPNGIASQAVIESMVVSNPNANIGQTYLETLTIKPNITSGMIYNNNIDTLSVPITSNSNLLHNHLETVSVPIISSGQLVNTYIECLTSVNPTNIRNSKHSTCIFK